MLLAPCFRFDATMMLDADAAALDYDAAFRLFLRALYALRTRTYA